MCNTGELENIAHFLARCPILREYRIQIFGKSTLEEAELINVLNGEIESWDKLVIFIKYAYKYRESLTIEFIY